MSSAVIDRRAALKARHREAIVAAARQLSAERQGAGFSVDELAARADVARRTLFNHFASVDEVLLAVCTDALHVLVDDFLDSVVETAVGDGSRSAMFDELAAALHRADLPGAIAAMVQVMGGPDAISARRADLSRTAFTRVGRRLMDEVVRRHPPADELDVELLVGSLMNGVAVIADHWIRRTGARHDAASRAEWDRLLARLLHSLRSGYLPA